MNTKLTLTIEEEIIRRAKEYAKLKNRSLSDIIENYLRSLTGEKTKENSSSPAVASLQGSFKSSKDMDYKTELQNRRERKYL